MAIPQLTPLPAPPLSTDSEATFNSKADATLLAEKQMVEQLNGITIPGINQAVTDAQGARDAAAASAEDAANSASQAAEIVDGVGEQVDEAVERAENARDAAQAAAAAAGAAAGLPALTGAGKSLIINQANNGVEFAFVGQSIGDVLVTARNPGSTYLPENGGIYLQSSYPVLFAALGLLGGQLGLTWPLQSNSLPTNTSFSAVETDNKGVWLIGGTSGALYRSEDDGLNWLPVDSNFGTAQIRGFAVGNDGTWVAVGAQEKIAVSRDSGRTWTLANSPSSPRGIYCAAYCGNSTWIAGSEDGRLFRSTNNGASWVLSTPMAATLMSIAVRADGLVMVCNTLGQAYRSYDRGATWSASTSILAGFSAQGMTSNGAETYIVVGTTGRICRSENSGVTWSQVTTGIATSVTLTDVTYGGSETYVAVGTGGTIVRSDDGGRSWVVLSNGFPASGDGSAIGAVATNDRGVGVAVSSNGRISRSLPFYSYDTATQFKLREVSTTPGASSYIKAKEAA